MNPTPEAPTPDPHRPEYSNWAAPAEDGRMLIWPAPAQIASDTQHNSQLLSNAHEVLIQNVPLPEVRRRQRAWIGHTDQNQPLIATGHQSELYHPGVWVKNVLINLLARQAGGVGHHFAIDTDSPKHLNLRWPGKAEPITDDEAVEHAAWTGLVAAPTPQHLAQVAAEFDDAAAEWSFEPFIEPFFSSLRRLSLEPGNLPSALSNSIHRLEWELGLRHHMLLVSPLWLSEPYLVFLHHLLARPDSFAATYNAALADYRQAQGIRSPARPMPDLQIGPDEIEIPFWLDSLSTGKRHRATIQRSGANWALILERGEKYILDGAEKGAEKGDAEKGDKYIFDPAADGWEAAGRLMLWLRQNDVRLAPRALTLTLFLRLFLADQFVHGIGGGRYDQVTDRVIEQYFRLAPPRFCVTTATLYFPAAAGQRRIDLHPLWQESRRIRHGLLSAEKRRMARQIAELPRRSTQRRDLFFKMHAKLATESNSQAVREVERRIRDAEHQNAAQRAVFDRELFIGIQPKDRLLGLMERYQSAFGGAV